MIILYGIMFAVIRRWFNIAYGIRSNNKPDALDIESEDDKKIKAVANSLLFYPAVFICCFFPNTLSRWLYFTDKPNNSPPYQFTLFASSIYALSGVFNLILFFLTRPKIVVGHPKCSKETVLPIHRRHDSEFSPKESRLDYNFGSLSIDIEDSGRPGSTSTIEIQSPSRTKHRPRSSYDLQGISSLPSSPTRNIHSPIRWNSSEVLDIGKL